MNNPEISVEMESGSRYICQLIGISGGQVQLVSKEYITEFSNVLIHLRRISIAGQVMYAHKKDDVYRVSISLRDYRRSEPRFPLTDRCNATILGDDYRSVAGRLKDVSNSGIGLILPEPCPAGVMMFVETTKLLIVGEIRYCRQISEAKYLVGIANTEVHEDVNPSLQKRWKSRLQDWARS